MALINVSFLQGRDFAAPRAYWLTVVVGYGAGATVTLSGDVIRAQEIVAGTYYDSYITMSPFFTPWSKGSWRIGDIFIDQRTFVNGGTTPVFPAVNCGYGPDAARGRWCAIFAYDGGTDFYSVDLPAAPPTYWQPAPPV